MQKEASDSRLVKKYIKLLRELNGLRMYREFPEEVLPAPKQAMMQALTTQIQESPEEKEKLEAVITTLDLFKEKSPTTSDLIAKLLTVPTIITVIYTIWLGFRGESWLWTISIVLIPLSVAGAFIWRYAIGLPQKFMKRFLIGMTYSLVEIVAIGSTGIVAIKLAFLSGFWGLIQSIGKTDWVGIILALAAIFLGYHMAKYTNRIFFFLVNNSRSAK